MKCSAENAASGGFANAWELKGNIHLCRKLTV
jgi:hypothetical protein